MENIVTLHSHPDKPLIRHLEAVADSIYDKLSKLRLEIEYLDKDLLMAVGYLAGIAHDFGKATKHFQKYILGDEQTKKRLKGKEETRHSFVSSIFSLYITEEYLKTVESIDREMIVFLKLLSYLIVRRHHSNLETAINDINKLYDIKAVVSKINDMDQSQVEELYKKLLERKNISVKVSLIDFKKWVENFDKPRIFEFRRFLMKLKQKKLIDFFFITNLLYSLLLDADKKDAAGLTTHIPRTGLSDSLVDNYKTAKFTQNPKSSKFAQINKLRNEIYNTVTKKVDEIDPKEQKIFTLEAFTGAGKTLTALSFALKLRNKIEKELGVRPRIIYTLPFLSIIDQNTIVVEDVFKTNNQDIGTNILLKHHHLSDILYEIKTSQKTTFEDEMIQNPLDIDKALLFIESWESEFVITTFVQLFHSLITNRNRAVKKLHNITNSILILDEIQSIPYKYWLVVHDTLTFFARKYNTWIVLMTATMPLIFNPDAEDIVQLVGNSSRYYKELNRINMMLNMTPMELDTFKEELLKDILNNPDKSFLIILNTIRSSKDVFSFLAQNLPRDKIKLLYLSTSVAPVERKERIDSFREETQKQKIMVSTQVVEAGVDISADIVYRDLAPLDSLVQSAGRCNRNNEKSKGVVKVVILVDEKNKRPFYSYIYDPFLVDKTKKVLQEFQRNTLSESEIYSSMRKYYQLVKNFMSNEESRKILGYLCNLEYGKTYEFRLIEEKGTSFDVFVELNEEAVELRKTFEEIYLLSDRYKRKQKWLEIKNDFYKYVVTVRMRESPPLPLLGDFMYLVEHSNKEAWYDKDTGFERKENTLML